MKQNNPATPSKIDLVIPTPIIVEISKEIKLGTQKKSFWTIKNLAPSLTIIISSITLGFSAFQFKEAARIRDLSNRPVLASLRNNFTGHVDTISPIITIHNYGLRSASNYIIKNDFFLKFNNSIIKYGGSRSDTSANSLVPGQDIDYGIWRFTIKDSTTYYFKVTMKYLDDISKLQFTDSFYIQWFYHKNDSTMEKYKFHASTLQAARNLDILIPNEINQ